MQKSFNVVVFLSLIVLGSITIWQNGFFNRYFHWPLSHPISIDTIRANPAKHNDRIVVVVGYLADWTSLRLYASRDDAENYNRGSFVRVKELTETQEEGERLDACKSNYVHVVGRLSYNWRLDQVIIVDVGSISLTPTEEMKDGDEVCYESPES